MSNSQPRKLSALARAIYRVLRRRIRANEVSITYAELVDELRLALPGVATHARSVKLHTALGEITLACQDAKLPCLPASVCRHDTGRPGSGYYAVAHPSISSAEARIIAWQREHARVIGNRNYYPVTL